MTEQEIVAEAIGDPTVPETLLEVFTPIVDEAKLHWHDDGITMRAVDPANVAMHFVELDTDAWESWDSPGEVTIAANLESILDRLGVARGDDLAHLRVDMATRKLHVDVGEASQRVAMIDPDAVRSEPDTPELEWPNTVVVTGEQLKRAIEVGDMVSDHLRFDCRPDDESVRLVAQGDTDDSDVTWHRDDVLEGSQVTAETQVLLSLDYLDDLTNIVPDHAEVTIDLGDDMPIQLRWKALEGALSVVSMQAPRISTS